jgi:hypothetical protein
MFDFQALLHVLHVGALIVKDGCMDTIMNGCQENYL